MSDDLIHAALDNALDALRSGRLDAVRADAVATIVAFLRVLQEDNLRLPGDDGLLLSYLPRVLADMVEKVELERKMK